MRDTPGDLHQLVEEFGQETAGLLSATLPGLPVPPVSIQRHETKAIVIPRDGQVLPLHVQGKHLADMKISIKCQLESSGQYLAVEESTYDLIAVLDRTPLLRIHYLSSPGSHPSAHVHVHGHRGALSHLLSPSDTSPRMTSRRCTSPEAEAGFARARGLHPVPDSECNFDSLPGWQQCVKDGRERWRRRQAASVARDMPEEAARVLRELGYKVVPPDPLPVDRQKALHNW